MTLAGHSETAVCRVSMSMTRYRNACQTSKAHKTRNEKNQLVSKQTSLKQKLQPYISEKQTALGINSVTVCTQLGAISASFQNIVRTLIKRYHKPSGNVTATPSTLKVFYRLKTSLVLGDMLNFKVILQAVHAFSWLSDFARPHDENVWLMTFNWHGLNLVPAQLSDRMSTKCGMKLLVHYHAATVARLMFGNGWLIHWGRNKMAASFLTTFSNAFSWLKIL